MSKTLKDDDGNAKTEKALTLLIIKRCILEGCRFGYEKFDKEPRDNCMYCGAPRLNGETWTSDPKKIPIR